MIISNPTPESRLAFTRADAARSTGLPLTTIDVAIESGVLPATRSGRRLVILAEDLQAWLRRCRDVGAIPSKPQSQDDKQRLADLNRARRAA